MSLKRVKQGELKNGDQIAVQGNVKELSSCLLSVTAHSGGNYFHHGIFLKEELAVIDFHGQTKKDATPKKRDFVEFFAGHTTLYRVEYAPSECLPVDETIQKAKEALEQGSSWPAYNLISNNCETFATYLKTGQARSKQVLEAMIEAAVGLGIVAGGSVTSVSLSAPTRQSGSCSLTQSSK